MTKKGWKLNGPHGWLNYWHDVRKEVRSIFSRAHGREFSDGLWCILLKWTSISDTKKPTLTDRHWRIIYYILQNFKNFKMVYNRYFSNGQMHKSRITKHWFNLQLNKIIDFSYYSPDLHLIENLGGIMTRKVWKDNWEYFSRT